MKRFLTHVVAMAATASTALGQEVPTRIQSIDDYLMDERYEVTLARSAAPDYVSADATILVFRRDGYHVAQEGGNGFTCLVERSWSSPVGLHRDFFNPELRAPICFNEEASRTAMQEYLRRTELALAGKSISEIGATVEIDIAHGRLRPPRALAMSYMLSGAQLLGTNTGRFIPHVMFYIPFAVGEDVGAPPPGCKHVCMFEYHGGPFASIIVSQQEFKEVDPPTGSRSN